MGPSPREQRRREPQDMKAFFGVRVLEETRGPNMYVMQMMQIKVMQVIQVMRGLQDTGVADAGALMMQVLQVMLAVQCQSS